MRASFFIAGIAVACCTFSCTVPREPRGREDTTCTWCHGDPSRAGDMLTRAAPPFDLRGNTSVEYPGVGTHQRHLSGTEIYPAVPCGTCHPVPDAVSSPGHDDGITQLKVAYEPGSRTCSGVACHGAGNSGVWTRPRADACGSCHGVPPAAPHPQAGACEGCHGTLSALTHVDGKVTLLQPVHCNACHGADESGAPPRAVDGGTSVEQRGVGAHARHLLGGSFSKPVACETCHPVPTVAMPATPTHPSGTADLLTGYDAGTLTCATGCHFGASPPWTQSGPLGCTGCHGAPPTYPHPQRTDCALCHPMGDRSLHVDGKVEVSVPTTCDACHGSATNPAPPRDLDGGTDRSRPGVGAHQTHVVGRGFARPVPCGECHVVPQTVLSPGHLDGVVQVTFSGAAVANLAAPTYSGGSCSNTACHDPSIWRGGTSAGGTDPAPQWATSDGGPTTNCWSCHGYPPPPPHVMRTDCQVCHPFRVDHHVDGVVDFNP
jgi:predicted CxxxxCH...CXXCH cytochrome family protein